jgi:hypothetical protein
VERDVESLTQRTDIVASAPVNKAAEDRRGRSSHPIVGTWMARSPASSADHRQPAMLEFAAELDLSDDFLTLTQIDVDPAGHESAMKTSFQVDGQDHPVQFRDDPMVRATWTDVRTLEIIARRGERIVFEATYEVSPDGQSLVVSTPETLVIFERV